MTTRDKDLQRRMEEIGQEMLEDDMIGEEEFEECMTRLRSLGSCNVASALAKIQGGEGCLTDMNMYSPTTMERCIAGPVWTVKMVHASDTTSPRPDRHFIDACTPGSILLIQTPPGTKSACWGGLMSTAAQKKGILGVVIDGACRDLAEHRALDFPVFARSHSTLGQGGFTRVSEQQCPLTIKPLAPNSEPPFPDTVVEPGYIMVADLDGVVTFDDYIMRGVIESAEQIRRQDGQVEDDLKSGMGVEESMKKRRPGYKVAA